MKRILVPFVLLFQLFLWGETWETALAGILTTPPAEGLDGRIYCTAEDRALHALDGVNGKEYWNYRPGRRLIEFTIVSPDGTIFVLTSQKDLIAVSPGGWELWRYRLRNIPGIHPAIDNRGIFYLTGEENFLYGIDRRGVATRLFQLPEQYTNFYVCQDNIIFRTSGKLDVYKTNGTLCGSIQTDTDRVVIRENTFWWADTSEKWNQLDLKNLKAVPAESPLPDHLIYPDPGILITDDSRIVSGRKDWFMEAYRQGAESYNSYYQPGCNSSRTNGSRDITDSCTGTPDIRLKSLAYIASDSRYLNPLLTNMESADTFYELINDYPDYSLQLTELISRSFRRSLHNEDRNNEIDSHSLYRIYRLLSCWGDLQTREALIHFCSTEEDPVNLRVIYRGLGRIGMDRDGRSITAIYNSLTRNPPDEFLFQEVLYSALDIARYNGGRSMKIYFEIMNNVSSRTGSPRTREVIRKIMRELL